MKLKPILLVALFLSSFASYSQSNEGEIIISEENLIHLIQKIRAKRDANYALTQNKETSAKSNPGEDLTEINQKLATLNSELKYLTALLESKNTATEKEEETVAYYIINSTLKENGSVDGIVYQRENNASSANFVENTTKTDTIYKTQMVYQPVEVSTSNKREKTRKAKKASKNEPAKNNVAQQNSRKNDKTVVPIPIVANSKEDNSASLEAIARLERKIDSLFANQKEVNAISNVIPLEIKPEQIQSRKDTVYLKDEYTRNYEALQSKFSSFKENVYFDNNSSTINDFEKIDTLLSALTSHKNLDVYLLGYASNTGNAKYNQELSFKRTEAIKRYLVSKGIHPRRILSQYHGIDYESRNEAQARRVELSYIIRK